MTAEISTLSSKIVYENKWMSVREDAVRFADGHEGIYGFIDKPDFAMVVPIHADGTIELVEQYRYPVGMRLWELPMGTWDGHPDAEPEEVAHVELAEETGYRAGSMERVSDLFQASGMATQGCIIFIATDLSPGEAARETEEQGMISRAFTLVQILEMVKLGAIKDVTTIAALGLLRLTGRL